MPRGITQKCGDVLGAKLPEKSPLITDHEAAIVRTLHARAVEHEHA